jgi:group I intron endonuclease
MISLAPKDRANAATIPSLPGIYKILNKVNNKFYIGSATNLATRRNGHLCLLRQNKHFNKHLQNSYNKYGKDNFIFSVLLIVDKEMLISYEQLLVDNLKPQYNKSIICVNTSLGRKLSDETKAKISKSKTGKKINYNPYTHLNRNLTPEVRKKWSKPGESHNCALLTNNDVQEIRKLLSEGKLYMKEIAKQFNVSCATIGDIKYNRSWTHLPLPEGITYPALSTLRKRPKFNRVIT